MGQWVEIPVSEAPMDGKEYARKGGQWIHITDVRMMEYSTKTSSTAEGDPANGKLAWNSAGQANATELYISYRTADNLDLKALWLQLIVGATLSIQSKTDSDQYMRYTVNSIIDNDTWCKLTVTPLDSLGTTFGGSVAIVVGMQFALGAV
jgi:hypothetical protein